MQNDERDRDFRPTAEHMMAQAKEIEQLVSEVARLRAAIEKAPHTPVCRNQRYTPCVCWKSEALKGTIV